MGSLAQTAPPRSGRTYTCLVADLYTRLDDEDTATLNRFLADKNISNRGLAAWLTENRHRISEGTIRKHRNNECHCNG